VPDARIAESTLGDDAVAACIAAAVARWRFPDCAGEVRYPFLLVPAGDDE
jgi:hypothetical protein